jgi:mRNA interferase MazF
VPGIDGKTPEAGDVLWIDFGPPVGHEQAGRRPALVISPTAYNEISSLVMVCPLTRSEKPWPFKVPVTGSDGISGFVLADQVHSIDPEIRALKVRGRVSKEVLAEVRAKLVAVLRQEPPV